MTALENRSVLVAVLAALVWGSGLIWPAVASAAEGPLADPPPPCANVPTATITLSSSMVTAAGTLQGTIVFGNLCPGGGIAPGATVDLVGPGSVATQGVSLTRVTTYTYTFSRSIAAQVGVNGYYQVAVHAREAVSGLDAVAGGQTGFGVAIAGLPFVSAGVLPLQSPRGPGIVFLDGRSSTFGGTGVSGVTYAWTQLAGPSDSLPGLFSSSRFRPVAAFWAWPAGAYSFRLTVSSAGVTPAVTSSFDTSFVVEDLPPGGALRPEVRVRLQPGGSVEVPLNAQAACDPNGDPTTFSWSSSLATTAAALLDATSSVARLRILTGDEVLNGSVRVTVSAGGKSIQRDVRVSASPRPLPRAVAGFDRTVVASGATLQVCLSGRESILPGIPTTDPSAALVFSWHQNTGPAAASIPQPAAVEPLVTLPAPGTYVFELEVSEKASQPARSSDRVNVTWVRPAGPRARAAIDVVPSEGSLTAVAAGSSQGASRLSTAFVITALASSNVNVALSGRASTSGQGGALTYRWSVVSRDSFPPAELTTNRGPEVQIGWPAWNVGGVDVLLAVSENDVPGVPARVRLTLQRVGPGGDTPPSIDSVRVLDGASTPLSSEWPAELTSHGVPPTLRFEVAAHDAESPGSELVCLVSQLTRAEESWRLQTLGIEPSTPLLGALGGGTPLLEALASGPRRVSFSAGVASTVFGGRLEGSAPFASGDGEAVGGAYTFLVRVFDPGGLEDSRLLEVPVVDRRLAGRVPLRLSVAGLTPTSDSDGPALAGQVALHAERLVLDATGTVDWFRRERAASFDGTPLAAGSFCHWEQVAGPSDLGQALWAVNSSNGGRGSFRLVVPAAAGSYALRVTHGSVSGQGQSLLFVQAAATSTGATAGNLAARIHVSSYPIREPGVVTVTATFAVPLASPPTLTVTGPAGVGGLPAGVVMQPGLSWGEYVATLVVPSGVAVDGIYTVTLQALDLAGTPISVEHFAGRHFSVWTRQTHGAPQAPPTQLLRWRRGVNLVSLEADPSTSRPFTAGDLMALTSSSICVSSEADSAGKARFRVVIAGSPEAAERVQGWRSYIVNSTAASSAELPARPWTGAALRLRLRPGVNLLAVPRLASLPGRFRSLASQLGARTFLFGRMAPSLSLPAVGPWFVPMVEGLAGPIDSSRVGSGVGFLAASQVSASVLLQATGAADLSCLQRPLLGQVGDGPTTAAVTAFGSDGSRLTTVAGPGFRLDLAVGQSYSLGLRVAGQPMRPLRFAAPAGIGGSWSHFAVTSSPAAIELGRVTADGTGTAFVPATNPLASSDSDGDGANDAVDANLDDDRLANGVDLDADANGVADSIDEADANGDGMPTPVDTAQDGPSGALLRDLDGDRVPDLRDVDLDGDGIANVVDSDCNGDGRPDSLRELIDLALEAADEGDAVGAREWFRCAHLLDPADGVARLGYAASRLLALASDRSQGPDPALMDSLTALAGRLGLRLDGVDDDNGRQLSYTTRRGTDGKERFASSLPRLQQIVDSDALERELDGALGLVEGIGLPFTANVTVPHELSPVHVDTGDVLAARAVLHLLKGFLAWVESYDLDQDLSRLARLEHDNDRLVFSTDVLEPEPGFLRVARPGRLVETAALWRKGLAEALEAFDEIVAETHPQTDDLITLHLTSDEERRERERLVALLNSLNGVAVIPDGTATTFRLNLAPLLAGELDLRALLPRFAAQAGPATVSPGWDVPLERGDVVPGTYPDTTFHGLLPDGRPQWELPGSEVAPRLTNATAEPATVSATAPVGSSILLRVRIEDLNGTGDLHNAFAMGQQDGQFSCIQGPLRDDGGLADVDPYTPGFQSSGDQTAGDGLFTGRMIWACYPLLRTDVPLRFRIQVWNDGELSEANADVTVTP